MDIKYKYNKYYMHVIYIYILCIIYQPSQLVLVVKKLPANAGDIRDAGLIPGLGRSPGGDQSPPVFLPGESHGQRRLARWAAGHESVRVSHDWSDLAGKHARMHNTYRDRHAHIYSNAVLPILFTEKVMNLREYKIY